MGLNTRPQITPCQSGDIDVCRKLDESFHDEALCQLQLITENEKRRATEGAPSLCS